MSSSCTFTFISGQTPFSWIAKNSPTLPSMSYPCPSFCGASSHCRPSLRLFKEPVGLHPINPLLLNPFSHTHALCQTFFTHSSKPTLKSMQAGMLGRLIRQWRATQFTQPRFQPFSQATEKRRGSFVGFLPSTATSTSSECASACCFFQLRLPREMNGGRGTLITPRSLHPPKSIQYQVVH